MEVSCKVGKLVISDRSISLVSVNKYIIWSVRMNAVLAVSVDRGMTSSTVEFGTSAGPFKAESVGREDAQKIALMFI